MSARKNTTTQGAKRVRECGKWKSTKSRRFRNGREKVLVKYNFGGSESGKERDWGNVKCEDTRDKMEGEQGRKKSKEL